MKLSKIERKRHAEAVALVEKARKLSLEERLFVAEFWNPMAEHNVGISASFFTPMGLARELQIETIQKPRKRVLDLFAGTGRLALYAWFATENAGEIVCIENNPAFIEVGKKVLPDANWIRADAFDAGTYANLGKFDEVICNPPYGLFPKTDWLFNTVSQYMAAEVAMKCAEHAVFILAQGDCPFSFSGQQSFSTGKNQKYETFHKKTGICFGMNCGLDTSIHNASWQGTRIKTEIVIISRPNTVEPKPETTPNFMAAKQLAMFA